MIDTGKKRVSYIDIAKFIGIFILLVEHTGNWTTLSGNYNYVKTWICSFHMPLFFIVLGLVISAKPIKSISEFAKLLDKRVKSLVIPYVIWCFIYQVGMGNNFYVGVLYGSNLSLGVAQTNQVLWFLPAMFVSMLLFQIVININDILKIQKFEKYVLVLEAILMGYFSIFLKQYRGEWGMPWGFDVAFMGVSFILFGFVMKELLQWLLDKKLAIVVTVLVIFLALGVYIALNNQPDEMWVSIMALAMYGHNHLLYIIGALINTFAVVIVSYILRNITLLTWLGKNSMLIMVVHYILFPYTVQWAVNLGNGHNILTAILNAVITVIMCIPIAFLVEHYAPILKGK